MRRESPDELTRLVVTALAVFIGGTAALVANDTIRAYRLEIAAKQAVIELNKELARQDNVAILQTSCMHFLLMFANVVFVCYVRSHCIHLVCIGAVPKSE